MLNYRFLFVEYLWVNCLQITGEFIHAQSPEIRAGLGDEPGGCSGLWVTPGKSREGLEGPGIACRFLGGAAGLWGRSAGAGCLTQYALNRVQFVLFYIADKD